MKRFTQVQNPCSRKKSNRHPTPPCDITNKSHDNGGACAPGFYLPEKKQPTAPTESKTSVLMDEKKPSPVPQEPKNNVLKASEQNNTEPTPTPPEANSVAKEVRDMSPYDHRHFINRMHCDDCGLSPCVLLSLEDQLENHVEFLVEDGQSLKWNKESLSRFTSIMLHGYIGWRNNKKPPICAEKYIDEEVKCFATGGHSLDLF